MNAPQHCERRNDQGTGTTDLAKRP